MFLPAVALDSLVIYKEKISKNTLLATTQAPKAPQLRYLRLGGLPLAAWRPHLFGLSVHRARAVEPDVEAREPDRGLLSLTGLRHHVGLTLPGDGAERGGAVEDARDGLHEGVLLARRCPVGGC